MSKAQILIAEDDGIVALDIKSRLQVLGYSVAASVASGKEAILKAKADNPDLVLMDIHLQGEMDGIEAAGQIQSQLNIPVVYLTAYADEKLLERAKITEPFGYILKPFEERGLHSTIEIALYKYKMEDKLKKRQAEISALLDASHAVLEHREFKAAARAIFDCCRNLIGAPAGYIALLPPDKNEAELLFLESGGMTCTTDHSLPMPIRGLRAQACQTKQAVYENEFYKSEWMKFMPEGHLHLENVLFTPLINDGETVGLLGVANKPGGFNENDARMATAFGKLVVIALLNSRNLESLEDSEARFRQVSETASDAIISIDSNGNIVFWNQGAKAIFGYTAAEMVDKPLALLMPERFRKAHQEGLKKAVATEKTDIIRKTVEMAGLRKDGHEFPLELSLASWKTREGIFFTGIIRDITDKKQKQAALNKLHLELEGRVQQRTIALQTEVIERRLAEEKLEEYKLAVESSDDAIAAVDFNYTHLFANQAFLKRHCLDQDQVVGHTFAQILGEDAFNTVVKPNFDRCFLGDSVSYEMKQSYPQIGERFVNVHYYPLKNHYGTISGVVTVTKDITERKVREQQIKESKAMLQAVFDGILEPLIMLNKDLQIKVLNKAAKQYYQISEYHEVVGCCCYEAFRGRSTPCEGCIIPAAIISNEATVFERSGFIDPSRSEQIIVYPLKRDESQANAAIIRISDITEAKLTQKQLLQSEKLASVGELAAGVAHEINNPINGVINYAQLLIDDAKNQGYGIDIPERILKEAERVASIVKNLLFFARETEDKPRSVDVHNIVADVLELVEKQLNNDNILLKLDINDDLPKINANSQKIQQVLVNLLSNARYALNQKYPGFHQDKVLQLKGEIMDVAGKKFLRITIHDKGEGIPGDIIDKICDPFFSTKPQGEGTGLGLSISYGIVEDHGGHLSFESKDGKYTTAIVDLPAITDFS